MLIKIDGTDTIAAGAAALALVAAMIEKLDPDDRDALIKGAEAKSGRPLIHTSRRADIFAPG